MPLPEQLEAITDMKKPNFPHLLSVAFAILILSSIASSQQSANIAPTPLTVKGLVVEVMHFKGRPLAYQALDSWSWYGAFQISAGWKLAANEIPIHAVKITLGQQDGVVKARVTVLRGKNMDKEDLVTDASVLPGQKTIVRELLNVGVEPFELQIVRAPSTVADPPTMTNKTKSLEVSVEPNQSTIPSFVARFLNNSAKPVTSFSYFTSVDGRTVMSGAPSSRTGAVLIQPGETYQQTFRYATKPTPTSTGEMPQVQSNLVLNITSVVFADGTYEGEAHPAAMFLAGKLGEKTQLRSFLDRVRAKGADMSEGDVEAAIATVNLDALAAEIIKKFPGLTAQEKAQLRDSADFGQSLAVKFFRTAIGNPAAPLGELLQARIDALP